MTRRRATGHSGGKGKGLTSKTWQGKLGGGAGCWFWKLCSTIFVFNQHIIDCPTLLLHLYSCFLISTGLILSPSYTMSKLRESLIC